MAIGDEGMPMMQEERRTVDLMHKPNGEPNLHNATPRIIKKEPRVSKVAPTASAAKAPAPSGEPVELRYDQGTHLGSKDAGVQEDIQDPAFGLKAQMQPYDASGDSGLSPHAEYSLEILREFFKRRPIKSLKDTFFMMDTNCSGKLDEEEFKDAMRHLHIDLTAKDSSAMFRAVDFDGSGELNFDEFYRSFRTDAFKRTDFFWGKVRARVRVRGRGRGRGRGRVRVRVRVRVSGGRSRVAALTLARAARPTDFTPPSLRGAGAAVRCAR